ncbi:apoptosis regulatory protein Siva [Galendromus occidentalis]|uniref:Apoptosis regulatory protein Siva n=1 Tax=Galendromus occidentalis TaxID=34638 RepID=A0AAJ6VWA7_9ACAR|nr:apoptosis regulatory protein Siva [Galendromus occidentalis]
MVAKRGFPFEDSQQGQYKIHVTEKVYNSTEQRISSVYERTLSKLMTGSRDFFRTQRGTCPASGNSPAELKECISCRREELCSAKCDFCDVAVCDNCARICHSCENVFCHMCSIVSYGERDNTAICFSCK